MLMSKTRVLLVVSTALVGCGSSPKHAEMVSNAPNAPASPLVDREKCNDRDKHVIPADLNGDKKPDVWKYFKTVDMGGQKTEVLACKQVDLNMDGKIDIDSLITHVMPLGDINRAFDLMHAGESIRSVVTF